MPWWPLVSVLALSPQSQTLRQTPLTSALRAARAHDAVLRINISRSALALHQDSRGYFGILSVPEEHAATMLRATEGEAAQERRGPADGGKGVEHSRRAVRHPAHVALLLLVVCQGGPGFASKWSVQ